MPQPCLAQPGHVTPAALPLCVAPPADPVRFELQLDHFELNPEATMQKVRSLAACHSFSALWACEWVDGGWRTGALRTTQQDCAPHSKDCLKAPAALPVPLHELTHMLRLLLLCCCCVCCCCADSGERQTAGRRLALGSRSCSPGGGPSRRQARENPSEPCAALCCDALCCDAGRYASLCYGCAGRSMHSAAVLAAQHLAGPRVAGSAPHT